MQQGTRAPQQRLVQAWRSTWGGTPAPLPAHLPVHQTCMRQPREKDAANKQQPISSSSGSSSDKKQRPPHQQPQRRQLQQAHQQHTASVGRALVLSHPWVPNEGHVVAGEKHVHVEARQGRGQQLLQSSGGVVVHGWAPGYRHLLTKRVGGGKGERLQVRRV